MADHEHPAASPDEPAVVADPALRAAKKARRRAAWAHRREQAALRSPEQRADLDDRMTRQGLELVRSLLPGPSTVCSYESWEVEPPTAGLNAALTASGHTVLVPVTLPDLDLDWRPLGAADDAPGLGREVLEEVRLVLAPATLVDASGTRLGQGGGCYDRTLPRLRPGTPVVAVLFDDELTDEPLPRDAHDQGVDAVLRPSGVVRLR